MGGIMKKRGIERALRYDTKPKHLDANGATIERNISVNSAVSEENKE